MNDLSPGPWFMHGEHVCDADGNVIVVAVARHEDARAIKTVPRILVALQECFDTLRVFAEAVTPPPEVAEKIENARRALAEATGTGEWEAPDSPRH